MGGKGEAAVTWAMGGGGEPVAVDAAHTCALKRHCSRQHLRCFFGRPAKRQTPSPTRSFELCAQRTAHRRRRYGQLQVAGAPVPVPGCWVLVVCLVLVFAFAFLRRAGSTKSPGVLGARWAPPLPVRKCKCHQTPDWDQMSSKEKRAHATYATCNSTGSSVGSLARHHPPPGPPRCWAVRSCGRGVLAR
jgi:hypothetical protein